MQTLGNLGANTESQVNLVNNIEENEAGTDEKPREEMLMQLAASVVDSRY